jgi:hypothetical protein
VKDLSMKIPSSLRNRARHIAVAAGALLLAAHAGAVQFALSSSSGDTWTYTLTYNPEDNYAITVPTATVTLSGLQGVTAATGPTSTDFAPPGGFLDMLNLDWTPQVLNGGTEVVWTHVGGGTGNFGSDMHVFGFSVTAPGEVTGSAAFATTGFSTDIPNPVDRDVSGVVDGPVAGVPEPETWAMLAAGLLLVGRFAQRRSAAQHAR